MVFNSYSFIVFFLPITLLGFYFFSRKSRQWAAVWLVIASLFFYGSWDCRFIPILLTSILINYFTCKRILSATPTSGRWWLTASITFNLSLLGFFKYVNFFIVSLNDVTSGNIPLLNIILPIGISFFTFTQISLLVDAYHGKLKNLNFTHYLLFASYFPYIVAGPILHHAEMLPQFSDPDHYQVKANNFVIGISIFVFGLGKKLLIADNLALAISPLFADGNPHVFQAWLGMLVYTLQLYFDFSGYSDMAIGVSRLMGFHIPINFNSPYKATSVSDFWQRWHISLSRFLRNYLYIPLGGNRRGQLQRYRNLILTMLLGGLWHGANWTFVIWGGLHGLYLCVQHGWQSMQKEYRQPTALRNSVNRIITFIAVLIAWCFFRAPDVASAFKVLAGMVGQNGISLVTEIDTWGFILVFTAALVAFFMPNTNELFLFPEKVQEVKATSPSILAVKWSPNILWGLVVGCIFALCILSIERTSDFIYAQF
ncbi:MAG: MBOAT family protein [Proteobacteria bacterium]|nr:MBOAT family protein [Pseudomonadota bacterium]